MAIEMRNGKPTLVLPRGPMGYATYRTQEGPVSLKPVMGGADVVRTVVRDGAGRYCVSVEGKFHGLRTADSDEVAALRDLFGDWLDPAWARRMRGDVNVETRTKRKLTLACPGVLLGLPGEVETVSQWPLTAGQKRFAWLQKIVGQTDCIIHFDRVRVGGEHNARRVRMHDGVVYVVIKRRCVPIGGVLLERVMACNPRAYDMNDWVREVQEDQAALANERYDAQNVHDDETKC